MTSQTRINPAHHFPTSETKKWLYDVRTFRGGDKLYPFVLELGVEELQQLYALLQLHVDDLEDSR